MLSSGLQGAVLAHPKMLTPKWVQRESRALRPVPDQGPRKDGSAKSVLAGMFAGVYVALYVARVSANLTASFISDGKVLVCREGDVFESSSFCKCCSRGPNSERTTGE